MNAPRRAVLVYGALSPDAAADEHDTLVQVAAVDAALQHLGFLTRTLELGRDPAPARAQLAAWAPEVAINLVESIDGDGRLANHGPELFEQLGLAYTGAPLAALRACAHKPASKARLAEAGIATPPWWDADALARLEGRRGPWIVKSAWEHASIGIDDNSVVHEPAHVREVLAQRARERGGEWFVERFVAGREFNLALLADRGGEPQVLPPAEIVFEGFPPGKPHIVGYAAKWETASFEYRSTARRLHFPAADRDLLARLGECARKCWRVFGLCGYARVDFRVDAAGRPWVLEVNPNPCLAPDAGFMAAAGAAGLTYDNVVEQLVAAALARAPRLPCSASAAS